MGTHIPVLLKETIENLNVNPQGTYLDLTIGRGGHSSEILKKLTNGRLIGFDQDETAITESKINLSKISNKFTLIHSNFVNFREILNELKISKVDGILMDLGVSSPQFDDPSRGFTYKVDTQLDMRMDQSSGLTASIVVNTYSLEDLTRIFREFGEEKFAYQIAKNICKARQIKDITTTFELVDIIKRSKSSKELKKEGHPAKQVFQALRIEVNNELDVLSETIKKALDSLNPHGRLAIITFHSLEDRIVKNAYREVAIIQGDRIDGPMIQKQAEFQLVNKKPIVASETEILENHRSISAKLRVIEKL